MSHTVFPDAKYKPFAASLADTSETVVYTCPATGFLSAHVVWLNLADDGGSARTATIAWRDDSASTTYVLVATAAIAANTALQPDLSPLVLEPGDTLRVTGSAAGIHISGTVIEVARTSRAG